LLYRALNKKIAGFLVFTNTGKTISLLARYRPLFPIYAFTPSRDDCESLTIYFGVKALYKKGIINRGEVEKEDIEKAVRYLESEKIVSKGAILIVLHGDRWNVEGGTSTIKIVHV